MLKHYNFDIYIYVHLNQNVSKLKSVILITREENFGGRHVRVHPGRCLSKERFKRFMDKPKSILHRVYRRPNV